MLVQGIAENGNGVMHRNLSARLVPVLVDIYFQLDSLGPGLVPNVLSLVPWLGCSDRLYFALLR